MYRIHVQTASCYSRYRHSSTSLIPLFPSKHYPYTCVYVGVNQHGQKTSISIQIPDACYVIIIICSRSVPWLSFNMPHPCYPILHSPLPDRVAPVLVKVVSPPLGWSSLPYFLVVWYSRGDTRGPLAVFEVVRVPFPGPLHFFLTLLIIYVPFILSP